MYVSSLFFLQTEFKMGQEKRRLVFRRRMRTFGKEKKIPGEGLTMEEKVCVCLGNESTRKRKTQV